MKSNRLFHIVSGVLTILVLLSTPAGAAAQGGDPTDDDVNAIAKQLYCPVCENIPLDACGTAACEQWRGIIRDQLAEGRSEEEIKAYFVAQYGDRVLAEPPRQGFNWIFYIVPWLVLIAGGWILYSGFRTWRAAGTDVRPGTKKIKEHDLTDDPYISRIEEELKKRSGDSK
jgi:cytochrome c-type biogenesis protein CcmH